MLVGVFKGLTPDGLINIAEGSYCTNIKADRSATLDAVCGNTVDIALQVKLVSVCKYAFVLVHPHACPNGVPPIAKKAETKN